MGVGNTTLILLGTLQLGPRGEENEPFLEALHKPTNIV